MKLHEFEAKRIFKNEGIPVPEGKVVYSSREGIRYAKSTKKKLVAKAQVKVGGRGKAGGILFPETDEEVGKVVHELLNMNIKGEKVEAVLLEERIDIERELYLGFTVDRGSRTIVCIGSSMGGVDIERVAEEHPERISRISIDPFIGLQNFALRDLFFDIGLEGQILSKAISIAKKLYRIFVKYDSELCEINPLVVTSDGNLIAADAVLNMDDNAIYRHLEFEKIEDSLEFRAKKAGLSYVELDGDIGIIGNGAGLVMATLDLVHFEGGKPANFCDVGGGARSDRIKTALELILSKKIRAILINIFGGITRCDEVANGIVEAFSQLEIDTSKIPIVVRLAGTNREEGMKILSSMDLIIVDTMESAARKVVEVSRG